MLLEVKGDFVDVLNWRWPQKLYWKFPRAPAGRTSRRWLGLAEVMKVGPKMAAMTIWQEISHQLAFWSCYPLSCGHTGRKCLDVITPCTPSLSALCGCSCPLQNQNSVLCHHLRLFSLRFRFPRSGSRHFPWHPRISFSRSQCFKPHQSSSAGDWLHKLRDWQWKMLSCYKSTEARTSGLGFVTLKTLKQKPKSFEASNVMKACL